MLRWLARATLTAMHTHAQLIPATAADLAGLERHEVVDGEIVEKAAPSGAHGMAQYRISVMTGPFFGRGSGDAPGGWWFATECEIELESHQVYLPDVAGWRIERVPEPPEERPVRITPDWVAEILSPSTAARDLGKKRLGYHHAHVGHYWIIDPIDRTLQVFRWTERGYLLTMAAGAGEVVHAEPFDALELDVSMLFGR